MATPVKGALAVVGGFHVLPVRAGDAADAPLRHLYFKRDEKQEGQADGAASAALFVINVPADSTVDDLSRVFAAAGKIKSVTMSDAKDVVTRHCTVEYTTPAAAERALTLPLAKWGSPVLAADRDLFDSTSLTEADARVDVVSFEAQSGWLHTRLRVPIPPSCRSRSMSSCSPTTGGWPRSGGRRRRRLDSPTLMASCSCRDAVAR